MGVISSHHVGLAFYISGQAVAPVYLQTLHVGYTWRKAVKFSLPKGRHKFMHQGIAKITCKLNSLDVMGYIVGY